MVSVASGGAADRIAARILFKVLRAGSGTPARYSSTVFGGPLPFAAELRMPDCTFFMRAMLQELPLQSPCPGPAVPPRASGHLGVHVNASAWRWPVRKGLATINPACAAAVNRDGSNRITRSFSAVAPRLIALNASGHHVARRCAQCSAFG